VSEEFRPVRPDEVSDLALLPKRFDAFAAEVRSSFELLGNKILPALERLEEAMAELGQRVTRLEASQTSTEHRLAALEARATKRKPRR
jgi:hypothetical protein